MDGCVGPTIIQVKWLHGLDGCKAVNKVAGWMAAWVLTTIQVM